MQDQSALPKKKKPLLPPDFVRAMLAGHSALGLAFAALIYVVCISGTLAVFTQELSRWEQPDAPLVEATPSADAVQAALRAGYQLAQADHAQTMYLVGPARTPGRFQVHYDNYAAGIDGEWMADAGGRLVSKIATPWSEFIGELHMRLHMPAAWGKFLVGLAGVALLSSLISGLLSHPRLLKDAFALRWGGSRRLWEADLHNRLGVWGLPFHVVVTVTGALLGLSTLIIGILAIAAYDGDREKAIEVLFGPRAGPSTAATPVPDVGGMIRQIQSETPGAEFATAFLQQIGTEGQIVQLGMHMPGSIAFSTTYRFDGAGRLLKGSQQQEERGPGQWILHALQPLHYGWFGGLPVKLLYGLLGLALSIVTHTGVAVWLARRRDKGRPARHWERAWTAVVWSQPLAFGTTAVAGLLSGESLLAATYLATIAVAVGVVVVAGVVRLASHLLRLVCSLALVTAAGVHVWLWRGQAIDPLAWYMDAAFLLVAVAMCSPLLTRPRPTQAVEQSA